MTSRAHASTWPPRARRVVPASLVAAALVAGLAGPARAGELDSHVEIDLGFNTRSPEGATLTTWAPNISAYAEIDDDLALSATWGLATLDAERAESSSLEPLNPYFAVHVTPELGDFRLRVGLGAALPIAEASDPAATEAYRTAQAVRGSWDPWLYRTETFSLVVPARLEVEVADGGLLLAADGAVFLHVGTLPGAGEAWGAQGAVEARGQLGLLDLGARVLAVQTDPDGLQLAAEPFVDLHLGPMDVSARLTINIDDPDGFAFDPAGIWGAHIALRYRF